jgi:hypothetical protein
MLEDWTRQSLIRVYTALTEHRKPFPESLSAISGSLEKAFSPGDKFPSIRGGLPIDGWGRPLVYSVQGTTFTLLSYGRDGKPGGTGFDRDLEAGQVISRSQSDPVYENPYETPSYRPTLRQFVFELPSKGMIHSCVLSGFLASILTLYLVRSVPASRRAIVICIVKIVMTILMTIIFASIIMQLHIPTGH